MKDSTNLYSSKDAYLPVIGKSVLIFILISLMFIISYAIITKVDLKWDFVISIEIAFIGITIVPTFFKYENADNLIIYDVLFINTNGNKISIPVKNFSSLYVDVKYKVEFKFETDYYKDSIEENKAFLNTRKHICVRYEDEKKLFIKIIDYVINEEKNMKVRVFVNGTNPTKCVAEVKFIEFQVNTDNIYIDKNFDISEDIKLDLIDRHKMKKNYFYNISNFFNFDTEEDFKKYQQENKGNKISKIKEYYNEIKK